MDVEARLLLYAVALGSAVGLLAVARRGAVRVLWFHTAALGAFLIASLLALAVPSLRPALATPLVALFCVFALVPSLIVVLGRALVRRRHFVVGASVLRAGALLLGLPAPLRREAVLYDALAASDRGDPHGCAERLRRLHAAGGLPAASGGGTLAQALPLAGARMWDEALAIIDAAPSGAAAVLSIEARAAAETGDLRRALRACARLGGRRESAALVAARRAVLAAAGRIEFLREAERDALPVLAGPRGTADLAIGRALEARGELAAAQERYRRATRGRGGIGRDAVLALDRIDAGLARVAEPDELELDDLLALETACRDRARHVRAARGCRPRATWGVSAVTTLVSAGVLVAWGPDVLRFLSVGALSTPLVVDEGQWWRLFATMFLHAGWVHLLMNVSAIVPVGILLERRIGSARWLLVYVVSGFVGSVASVYINATDVGVGASGAAMGLIGALIVLLMRRPALFPSAERKRWLYLLWGCVAATVAIGLLESQYVDNAAHGAGLVAGALVALGTLPLRGAPLGASPGALIRSGARLAASLVVALTVFACWRAAVDAPRWWEPRRVVVRGAEAIVPGWLHERPALEGGVVLSRPPTDVVVLLGALPYAVPRPIELLPEGGPLRRFYRSRSAIEELVSGEIVLEATSEADRELLGPTFSQGLRFVMLRDGRAFALVLTPAGAEARAVFEPFLAELEGSLREAP